MTSVETGILPPGHAEVWTHTVLADRRKPVGRHGPVLATTWRLVVGSVVALLLLAAVGYLVGGRLAERQVLMDARHFNSLLGDGLIGPYLTPELVAGDPGARAELDVVVRDRLIPHSSLRRVKVWSTDGRILYSDDHREIGRQWPLTASQRLALRTGGPVAEVSDLDERETTRERRLGARLLEVYSRVDTADGERLLFETYMSHEHIQEQRGAVYSTLGLLAVAGVVLFAIAQLGLALLNVRWLRRRQAELDQHSRVVAERARQRLARDLHDGPVQDLVGVSYVVEGVLQSIRGRRMPETERLLEEAAGSVRCSIRSLRSVMVEVYPRAVHEHGLAAVLDDLAEPMRNRGLDVGVTVLLDEPVSAETAEALFRAAQEALRNIVNHARAESAEIRVEDDGTHVELTIVDDGAGLDPGPVGSPSGHLGLRALTDIAVERDGSLEIWSAPGQGTRLRMELHR